MALTNVYVGSYGWPVDTQIKQDGEVFDCSWVTTVTVKVKDESDNVTTLDAQYVGFNGDPSLGVVRWTVPEGLLDAPGSWSYQVILSSDTKSVPCSIVQFNVAENIE